MSKESVRALALILAASVCVTSLLMFSGYATEVRAEVVTTSIQKNTRSEEGNIGTRQMNATLSLEHVNLVRVTHEAITDVVFDTEALEIEPDRDRGIAFIRVKPTWYASGKNETAAFFNTKANSYGVTFRVKETTSRTVTIPGKATETKESATWEGSPATVSETYLRNTAYIDTLKDDIKSVFCETPRNATEIKSMSVFIPDAGQALSFDERFGDFNGFRLRERRAAIRGEHLIEAIEIRNMKPKTRKIPVAALVKPIANLLAVGTNRVRLAAGETTRLILVSELDDSHPALKMGGISRERASEKKRVVRLFLDRIDFTGIDFKELDSDLPEVGRPVRFDLTGKKNEKAKSGRATTQKSTLYSDAIQRPTHQTTGRTK